MSGDVQPRKRKDKRRKKDELGVEEPRGTAAVFGEGDVLMHSHHDHGTGGHWCAKIIFFSLLAVLITLIGLIILENRGLSELEANAVESRYSGVLEGWIEDTQDDDHHDEHTLELNHPSYEDIHDDHDDHDDIELEHEDDKDDDEEGHSDEFDDEENEEDDGDIADNNESDEQDVQYIGDDDGDNSEEQERDDVDDDDNSEEQEGEDGDDAEDDDIEENDEDERDVEDVKFHKYDNVNEDEDDEIDDKDSENDQDLEGDDDDSDEDMDDYRQEEPDDDEGYTSIEQKFNEKDEDIDSKENESKEEEQDEEDDDDETDEEIEKIEKEVTDEEVQAVSYEDNDSVEEDGQDDEEENDDDDATEGPSEEDISVPPVVEPIIAPKGKPFVELDDETSPEKPADTLAEEEEYERRQEELRQQKEESSSQMWLKLVVGGALLVATHAVIRRSTARDTPEVEDNATPEETSSYGDRRMTLIPPETKHLLPEETYEPVREEPVQKVVSEAKTVQSAPISKYESEEEEEEETPDLLETEVIPQKGSNDRDKELYSDDEDAEEEQDLVEEEKEEEEKGSGEKVEKDEESEPEGVVDDVEIIEEEQIEEEEEDEEEISDVDDAELLSRLEAKYGRLPEPERPEQKHKDGGNSVEDDWPGEPSEQYWRQQLDHAEREIRQGEWTSADGRLAAPELAKSGRARWLAARSLDAQAEAKRDNALLTRSISAYLQVLKMYESLSDTKLREVAARALDRIQFRGNYLSAEPVYRLLIRRFPNDVSYRNNLTVSFLMANRADLASDVLKETLKLWPEDRIALAHYAFVLKTNFNKVEESVALFRKALENDEGPACEPRFYYHLGDALLLLNRFDEAHEVHKRGAKHGHFLSPSQRSLYNVERLKSRPWWRIEETPYIKLVKALEKQWKDILREGEAAKAIYEKEKEGLKEKGEWTQLDIFVRGQEIPGRCKRAPVTCSIVKAEVAAANCRRGQIKFSSMEPGTHVRPHVGPTNCRLRMHLGLSNTKDTYIRVDKEIRQWQTGKVLLFDDSFEHEVWHNGTGTRLVLIVDVWHPDLTAKERRQLPAI